MGGQLYQLHRRHAADYSWTGLSPSASGSRTRGFSGNSRHDPQGSASCGSGEIILWPRKSSQKNLTGLPAKRKKKRATGSIWKLCVRRAALAKRKSVSDAVWVPSLAELPARATKDRSPVAVIPAGAVLKADRCRCIAAFPSADFAVLLAPR